MPVRSTLRPRNARQPRWEGRRAEPDGGDERYRAYDAAPVRRRNWWPWVVAPGALLAIAVGGWFLYDKVQKQIDKNKPLGR